MCNILNVLAAHVDRSMSQCFMYTSIQNGEGQVHIEMQDLFVVAVTEQHALVDVFARWHR